MSEKKKKVFISGPMSGIKDYNKPAFDRAEQWLTQAGYSVFNPARMHFDDTWTHEEIMRIDLAALTQCDYICMLGGWESSIGAMQEYRYAMATGIDMFHSCYIEHPKKEEKPKPRIEIETFGDISGENLDFLRWVEKNVNEVLARGGKLKEAIEIQIHNTTYDILRMIASMNNSVFVLNPDIDPSKTCVGCKYHKYSVNEEPCKSCNPILHTNWEDKTKSDAPKKSCNTCKHFMCPLFEEPCNSCNVMCHTNWEAKDAEK